MIEPARFTALRRAAILGAVLAASGCDGDETTTSGSTDATGASSTTAAGPGSGGGTAATTTGAGAAAGTGGDGGAQSFPSAYAVDKNAADYVVGEDWQPATGVTSLADLEALDQFGSQSACFPSDLYAGGTVTLAPDPLWGQVVDIFYPVCATMGAVQHFAAFPADQDRIWYRAIYRWKAPYTSAGANPPGAANSQKHMFIGWAGANSRKEWEFTNTTGYAVGLDFRHPDGNNTKYGFTYTALPNLVPWTPVVSEWTDDEWYEFVFWYEITQPGPYGEAKEGSWKRRLTQGGSVDPGAWEFEGTTITFTDNPLAPGTGEQAPLARGINLFANRNKSVDTAFHIQVAPWVVVNGADPWGLRAQFGL